MLVSELVERVAPKKIVLFGSHAKGTDKSYSDLDLLVVLRDKQPVVVGSAELVSLFQDYPARVEIIFRSETQIQAGKAVQHSFLASILESGQVVYDGSAT